MRISCPFKQRIAVALTIGMVFQAGLIATPQYLGGLAIAAEPIKGSIIKTDKHKSLPTVNENDIKTIEPGTTLDMVISTPLTPGVNMSGDEFFGKISKDYVVNGKVVIPKGTIVHGIVEEMKGPGRAGRNGYISTRFDYLITPDGREISIEGQSTTRDPKLKAAAKVVGRAGGYTAIGGAIGALMVVKYGGIAAIAASEGYALAGGAAVGGAIGLTTAMLTKGKHAMLQPGAEIRVKLQEDLHLPSMNMPDASEDNYTLEGLTVKVLGLRYDKDPFGEMNEINLTLDVTNKTENTFSTFEIALEDEFGNVFYPSPFGDTGMWFSKITPNSHCTSNITFNVDNIKLPHKLVFFKQYTREPLAKISLTDSMILDKKEFKKLQSRASNE
ncbi:MAG TPA: hypothetical protein V6C99_06595 [Oculatellaceae cyanobacterium]